MKPPTPAPMDVYFDHAGFIVEDLGAVSALMSLLGFTQTARADHTRTNAQGGRESAGSTQHCIMLRSGYIELMQITDPTRGHQLAAAPSVRHGLHLLGLGTRDAAACRAACVRNGVQVTEVLHWSRPVKEAGVQGTAQFAYFGSAWQATDPSYVFWVEHRTPELLRSPALVAHANGAAGVAGLVYSGPEPLARAWAAQLQAAGLRLERGDAEGVSLSLPDLQVSVRFDNATARVVPVALEMHFDGCSVLRSRSEALGIDVVELAGGGLDLNLVAQTGLRWICRPLDAETGQRTINTKEDSHAGT